MEDKWFVYWQDDTLYLHRSWTGEGVYKVELKREGADTRVQSAAVVRREGVELDETHAARLLDFLVSNLLLGQSKPFPMPAGRRESAPGLIQHSIAGTGYRQVEGEE